MPRKRWIDKNKAQTFQLLYRPQNDPALHDESAGDRALYQVSRRAPSHEPSHEPSPSHSGPRAGLHLADLEDGLDFEQMRDNEGEAAEHGIYFDDTVYDYMQHLRDMGEGGGESHVIDSVPRKGQGQAGAVKLEDAIRAMSLRDGQPPRGGDVASPYTKPPKVSYQNQQDVPDEIAGFQPDMDHRLREALEALEDDAFVDNDDDDDIFGTLAKDGQNGELDLAGFRSTVLLDDDDDDGWESDVTEKATVGIERPVDEPPTLDPDQAAAEDGDWLRDFAKFKRDSARVAQPKAAASIIVASATQDTPPAARGLDGPPLRQKRRKGALTNPSAYSMTSSSLARTEGQQILDARFDQVEKMYSLDEADEGDELDGGTSVVSGMTGMTGMSHMSQLSTTSFADDRAVRADLDSLMDGFLDDWNKANPAAGRSKGAKGKGSRNGDTSRGVQQLDQIRAELGPARLNQRRARKT